MKWLCAGSSWPRLSISLSLPWGTNRQCFQRNNLTIMRWDFTMFNTLASKTYLSFQDTTFLTRTEILRVFRRFCEIQEIPYKKTQMTYEDLTQIIAKYSDLCKCPELKENPFRKRICKVFSSDDSGNLTFDQFVYLFSVFSEKAPREMKVQFAFKIYGNFSKIIWFSL